MRLLSQLKLETADAHSALERSMNLFEQVQTRDDYRRLLSRFLSLIESLESRLAAFDWSRHGFDFAARRKADMIREDLRELGLRSSEITSLPLPEKLPALTSFSEAAGCLYVLEGSTLGGQILSKHFQERLGVSAQSGGRFFHGYGSHTGTRWREFGLWLDRVSEGPAFDSGAARGARETFQSFAQWLTS